MLTGEWTPKELVDLSATPDALATEQLRNLRREMDERATRKRTREMGLGDAIATDKYRCRDCLATGTTNANNCAYFNLQNHRDVRKNETWGSKDSQADDGRVLVRCLECKAEWNEATL
jgi:transcription elongation factor S-II